MLHKGIESGCCIKKSPASLSSIEPQAKERITRKQKSGRTSAESLTPIGRSSRPHDKEMSMITLAPTEALGGKPVKLIILGENLPVREDLVVEFSSTWWSTGVVPDVQHHGCAVQVFVPALDVEIEQRMRVEVKLVNTNTGEESGAKDFFFMPNKETKDKPRMDEEAKTVIEADTIEEFNPKVTFVAERNKDHEKSNEIKTIGKKVEDTGKDSRQTTGGNSRTIKESSPSKSKKLQRMERQKAKVDREREKFLEMKRKFQQDLIEELEGIKDVKTPPKLKSRGKNRR